MADQRFVAYPHLKRQKKVQAVEDEEDGELNFIQLGALETQCVECGPPGLYGFNDKKVEDYAEEIGPDLGSVRRQGGKPTRQQTIPGAWREKEMGALKGAIPLEGKQFPPPTEPSRSKLSFT